MGESGSLLSKNGWEWLVFSQEMGGSGLFFLKKRWEWVRVGESGWERNSVKARKQSCKKYSDQIYSI